MNEPRVGVSVIVWHEDKILVGKRKGSHSPGTWGLPGGKIDPGEHANITAMREVYEETGLYISAVIPREWSHAIWTDEIKGPQNWVTLMFEAYEEADPSQVKIMEPEKCEEWRFVSLKELGLLPLFLPLRKYLDKHYQKLEVRLLMWEKRA